MEAYPSYRRPRTTLAGSGELAPGHFAHKLAAGEMLHATILASVLQEAEKNANILAGSGVIWGFPVQEGLGPEK
jgi:hypothetical protein